MTSLERGARVDSRGRPGFPGGLRPWGEGTRLRGPRHPGGPYRRVPYRIPGELPSPLEGTCSKTITPVQPGMILKLNDFGNYPNCLK